MLTVPFPIVIIIMIIILHLVIAFMNQIQSQHMWEFHIKLLHKLSDVVVVSALVLLSMIHKFVDPCPVLFAFATSVKYLNTAMVPHLVCDIFISYPHQKLSDLAYNTQSGKILNRSVENVPDIVKQADQIVSYLSDLLVLGRTETEVFSFSLVKSRLFEKVSILASRVCRSHFIN